MRCFRNRHGWALRIVEDPVAERDEVCASVRERSNVFDLPRKANAGNLEQLRPPRHSFDYRIERRTVLALVGVAEHHVVSASLRSQHGIMAGLQAAATGDARRLERAERGTVSRNSPV